MGKVTNITPEEREQAITTINKLGEEVTEDKIDYYVQLRRNTISYQNGKKYKSAPAPIESVKKVKRLANIAIWASIIAIVMCFVTSGFGFSFWWYLVIVGLILIVLVLMGTISIPMKQSDIGFAKNTSIVCFVCIGLLWTCGPLNSDYERNSDSDSYGYDKTPTKTQWQCSLCDKTFEYYKDEIGEHDKWKYWSGKKICYNCYEFRKSFNDALKKNNSPYADYNN